MKNILFLLPMLLSAHSLIAQKHNDSYYREHPVWIQYMEQDGGNYEEALHAFNLFWDQRQRPSVENDLFEAEAESDSKADSILHLSTLPSDVQPYVEAYRKFLYWQQKIKPYVQEDGRILTKAEQLQQWRNSRKDRK